MATKSAKAAAEVQPGSAAAATPLATTPVDGLLHRNGITRAAYEQAVARIRELECTPYFSMARTARQIALKSKMASGLPLLPIEVAEFESSILATCPRYAPAGCNNFGRIDRTEELRDYFAMLDSGVDRRHSDTAPSPFSGVNLSAIQDANDAAHLR